jgi:hypothetical protein
MANLSITGKFLGASARREVGTNKTPVRDFWIDCTTNPDWPNTPQFELKGEEKCALADGLAKGQEVEVFFNLEGRKWEKDGKRGVYNTVRAWRIVVVERTNAVNANRPAAPASVVPGPAPITAGQEEDLPF